MNRADKKIERITKELMKYDYDCSFIPYHCTCLIALDIKGIYNHRYARHIVKQALKNLSLEELVRGHFIPF